MKIEKKETETYVLTDMERLDPVTVYVTNHKVGQGKIVIECFGESWSYFWGGMGERSLQQFFVTCENDYVLGKLVKETRQTDFDEINGIAHTKGVSLSVGSDVDIAMQMQEMDECFGPDWHMDLPKCNTQEYHYVDRIVSAIKAAFSDELKVAA